ncbi:hypothetical protein FB645_003471, partial [Coemansia sp. IMI 203386]
PKHKPKRIPIAKRKFKTRPRRNPGREYKRKEKCKARCKNKRKTIREAKAAAPPKQLSAKRHFADVDSGSDDEVPLIKLLKDVRRRG